MWILNVRIIDWLLFFFRILRIMEKKNMTKVEVLGLRISLPTWSAYFWKLVREMKSIAKGIMVLRWRKRFLGGAMPISCACQCSCSRWLS